MRNSEED